MYGNEWWFWFPLTETTVIVVFEPIFYSSMYYGVAKDSYGYCPDDNETYDWFEANTGEYKEMSQWYERLPR